MITSDITEEHIKNHFICNPVWEEIYKQRFPDAKTEEYTNNFYKLLSEKGYTYTERRMNDNPKSKFYTLKYLELFYGKEWLFEAGQYPESTIYAQVLIWCVCDHDIDINTLR